MEGIAAGRRMSTNELIGALVADLVAVDRARAARRFWCRLACGAAVSLGLMLLVMELRTDLGSAAARPMFWMELLLFGGVALAAVTALRRLGHPGMRQGRVAKAIALFMTAGWLTAALILPPLTARLPLADARWFDCLARIGFLSLPTLGFAFRAVRELAPIRPALAGAAAGLFAGAMAAFFSVLSYPEAQAPHLLVGALPAVSIPAAVGALLGPRVLRW